MAFSGDILTNYLPHFLPVRPWSSNQPLNMADIVEQNKAHFNQLAKEYDEKYGKTADDLIRHIRSLKDFIGVEWTVQGDKKELPNQQQKDVKLLDYACGTGMVSRALGPFITSSTGIDITENMVSIYNTRANNQGLSPTKMQAYVGDICSPPTTTTPIADPFPHLHDFDIAGVGLGFHHFTDPDYAAVELAKRLKTGGVLFVIDFLPHDELLHSHAAAPTVTAHGFSEERIREIFVGAGCGKGFAMAELGSGIVFEGMGGKHPATRHVFLARGEKE